MIDAELLGPMTQFGTAGLIAAMWLAERRAAGEREQQLREAHDRLRRSQLELAQLVEVVQRNTRAMAALRCGQRELARLVERLAGRGGCTPPGDTLRP